MAKSNYQFEKRQRDLTKKRKQEEKRQRKLAKKIPADDASPEASADRPEPTESDAAGETTGI
ncbi:MAG TPA: hypothetical protein VIW72_06205 [Burkholderiales bacterium]